MILIKYEEEEEKRLLPYMGMNVLINIATPILMTAGMLMS
jgi:hypothetical protein